MVAREGIFILGAMRVFRRKRAFHPKRGRAFQLAVCVSYPPLPLRARYTRALTYLSAAQAPPQAVDDGTAQRAGAATPAAALQTAARRSARAGRTAEAADQSRQPQMRLCGPRQKPHSRLPQPQA